MLEWLFGKKKEQAPPAPKKSTAEQQAEDKWKYDFLVQFLSGPVWKVSILDFVDYHCVVFDSEEENKFEYTTIHNKFKQLVADLFDGMMSEVGLDEEKLAELLEKGFQSKHRKIFNQLLLADDFLRFKQLMVSRNKTLEAEAVKALAEQGQIKHKPQRITEEDLLRESQRLEQERRRKMEEEEEEQLRKVLEMSKIEAEEQTMIKSLEEKAALRETHQEDHKEEPPKPQVKQPEHKVQQPPQPEPKVEEKPQPVQEVQPEPAPSHIRHKPKKNLPGLEPLPPLRQPRKQEEPRPEPVEEKPAPVPVPPPVPAPVAEEKVEEAEKAEVESQQDRKKRLLEQRERIRRKKEEERKKQLVEEENKPTHVQTIVLQEDGIHDTQHGEPQKEKVSQDEIQRRRELMKKIKNRIVDDF